MTKSQRDDELITLAEVQAALPPGARANLATISKWCIAGVRGVILESTLIGGRRYSNRRAVREFISALNEQAAAC